MIFTQDRTALREYFATAWRKHTERQPLEPLEAMLADVISLHPEYHALLEGDADKRQQDYKPEMGTTNPFLHLAMHVAIREQLSVDRPAGIRALHTQLAHSLGDAHEADHSVMECLAEALWRAQRDGLPPDEDAYRDCVAARARR